MCFIPGLDPITLTIGAIGTAISTAGSIAQGNAAQAQAEAQAQALEQQAKAEQQASAFEAAQQDRKNQLARSAARAAVGASGLGFSGSPTEVLTAQAGEDQLDLEAIRYGSTIRQNNLSTQAAISRFEGKQAKTASRINAASSFVSGISQLYDPKRAAKLGQNPFS